MLVLKTIALQITVDPDILEYLNNVDIQGVSEFHRQTFQADSMITNKHKTFNTYGVKNPYFAR
jgi:hypothetical protein